MNRGLSVRFKNSCVPRIRPRRRRCACATHRFSLAPSSDPRATHPVLWVFLACQPDVLHHVILKQCFALVIANTCSHSPGMLTQILDSSTKERLHQLLSVRVYLRLPISTSSDKASVPFEFLATKPNDALSNDTGS